MIGNNPLTYRKRVRDRENRLVELAALYGYREFVADTDLGPEGRRRREA
jgi:hypothetical protein